MLKFTFILIALLSALPLAAADPPPSPAGVWKTVDDKTNKPRGLIRIFEQDGTIFGKIEASFDPEEARSVCAKCTGDRKDKPIIGLLIMSDMKKKGSEYLGEILDPDTGWTYRCRMTLEDGGQKLLVRGFLGMALFGRTQTWFRQQ